MANGDGIGNKFKSYFGYAAVLLSLAVTWGVTLEQLAQTRSAVTELKQIVASLHAEQALHEKLPWHGGYAATLPLLMAQFEDIQGRLRTLEAASLADARSQAEATEIRRKLYGGRK
jgi:hypothetical protein